MTECVWFGVAEVEKERSMSLENTPSTLYDSVCVSDLSDLLGNYNSQNSEHKPSPAASTAPGTPAPAANYLHEGQSILVCCVFM